MPLFSCWMRLSQNDESYLRKIINDLAGKYTSPIFLPHLTIYGSIQTELREVQQAIQESINKINPFFITIDQLSFSEQFFKTVFIDFKKDKNLSTIYHRLNNNLQGNYELKPHISLIYKTLNENIKMDIIKNLSISKKGFTIDRISIVSPGENKNDWYNISEWKVIYTEELGNK